MGTHTVPLVSYASQQNETRFEETLEQVPYPEESNDKDEEDLVQLM